MEVNAELYEFLRNNETGMFRNENGVTVYVHVWFHDLDEFTKIVGDHCFDEGGMDVQLHHDTVSIELNDVIENQGHDIYSYKNCFEESDIKHYGKDLQDLIIQ